MAKRKFKILICPSTQKYKNTKIQNFRHTALASMAICVNEFEKFN